MMNYGPLNHAAVPTLGGWMLILLSLMLMVVAFKMAKRRGSSVQKLFITLLGVSAIFAGSGGVKLVSEVEAAAPAILLSNPNGGTVSIIGGVSSDSTIGRNQYTNTSGVIQVIKSIDLNGISCAGYPRGNGAAQPECIIGLQLQPNAMCVIDCSQVNDSGYEGGYEG